MRLALLGPLEFSDDDGMSHEGSVGTGTVMRADRMRSYTKQAGFSDAVIQPIENDLWRFYLLV